MSSQENVRSALQRTGLGYDSYVSQGRLRQALSSINGPFSATLFEELVGQCKTNSAREISVRSFGQTVCKATRILRNRISQQQTKVRTKQIEINSLRTQLNQCPQSQVGRRQILQNKYNLLEESYRDFQQQLSISKKQLQEILQTFDGSFSANRASKGIRELDENGFPRNRQNSTFQQFDCGLRTLLILASIYTFFQIIICFSKTDFLNLIVCLSILSIFMIGYFDSTYIKFVLAILVVSLVFDIIWLSIYWGPWFSPPANSELSHNIKVFYQFCCVMTIVLMLIKLPMGYILFRHRDVENVQNKLVQLIGGKALDLANAQVSPISKKINS